MMKLLGRAPILLLLLSAGWQPPVSAGSLAGLRDQRGVQRLAWMAGCWEQRRGSRVTEEQWMRPVGNAMLGMSRTVVGEQMRAWESLRILEDTERTVYLAQPNGGPATSFVASVVSDTLAVFENPAHDFPQRIAYRRISADSLVAQISAERNGATRRMEIPMQRVACP